MRNANNSTQNRRRFVGLDRIPAHDVDGKTLAAGKRLEDWKAVRFSKAIQITEVGK